MRVIVSGRLKQRSYETKEGEKRTVYEIEADDVGPSLRNASAKVTRAQRSSSGFSGRSSGSQGTSQRPASSGRADTDPWASDTPANWTDEPPF